jgi:para-aminobenzoate synthetase/4-amino-4-deoxychorismate lyase
MPDRAPVRIDSPRPDARAGVFETLLVVRGRPLELDAHLARLGSSVRELHGEPAPGDARELLLDAAAGAELARMRMDVRPGAEAAVRVVPVDAEIVLPPWERGIELVPVVVPGGIGCHKWADRRLLDRAETEASPGQPLLVDADGSVLETSRGSLFAAFGGALVTPALDGRILPGVTRSLVVALAGELGIVVSEEELPLDRLAEADEAFVTGAVRGVEHVRACAGMREWPGGELTARLAAALRRAWLRGA